jgi:hypothetical protein
MVSRAQSTNGKPIPTHTFNPLKPYLIGHLASFFSIVRMNYYSKRDQSTRRPSLYAGLILAALTLI